MEKDSDKRQEAYLSVYPGLHDFFISILSFLAHRLCTCFVQLYLRISLFLE